VSAGHTLSTEKSSARVTVTIGGITFADTTHAVLLHETGLPTRYYLPRGDIAMERLIPTDTSSHCPFKGDAVYWSARLDDADGAVLADVAWSYEHPIDDRADITGLVCFFDEKVDEITVDGAALARPETQWSTPAEA
jgi:uncharacterized protein (DUF427 family)